MWQRTYRPNSHQEGSKFESIRPNRSSTMLQPNDYKAYALCLASNHQILVTPSTYSHLTISSHVRSTTADRYLQVSEAEDLAIRVIAASILYVNRCICIQQRSQVINPNYTLLRSCSVCVNVAVGYCLAYIEMAFQNGVHLFARAGPREWIIFLRPLLKQPFHIAIPDLCGSSI